jgi:type IV secretion system protein VirB2
MHMKSTATAINPAIRSRSVTMLTFSALFFLVFFAGAADAQGLEKVNSMVERIVTVLNTISIGVVTIAIIFAGYKIAFQQARFADVMPILIGGILIGAAAQLAAFLIN